MRQKVYLADRYFRGSEIDLFLLKKQINFAPSKKSIPSTVCLILKLATIEVEK